MPLNYENLYKKMGIVFLGGSLILSTMGCSGFGSKESSKSKSAITKKADKSKPEEKKANLNKQDFEAITENAIQSKDNEVAYVLDELDKSKINFKDKSIVSNLQNGDETTSRVLALFDKETTDKTLQDTTKDSVIAAITDNKPQVIVNGDHFAFGDQNIDSSVASIGDILPPEKKLDEIVNPPVTPEGENGGMENPGTEKPKPPVDPLTESEKPKPPVDPLTESEKPKPPVDPSTEPEKPKPPVDPPTEPEKPKPPVDPPTDPEKPKPPVDPPMDPEKPKPPVDPPTNPEKPTELNKQESKSDVTV
ncbi:hemagglutinin [Bacillus cereus group sp. N8]|uniref:hemagglutinin n=1 Tax=Bacillus cereus group sp. N8 TaxID=2794584 RepID=UPI0018F73FB6|nr:hemagglutinin [Bacillus cereus group sp. N8]MBJ8107212.1 hemagglutinin [Bacillus cereus group sp. N8]